MIPAMECALRPRSAFSSPHISGPRWWWYTQSGRPQRTVDRKSDAWLTSPTGLPQILRPAERVGHRSCDLPAHEVQDAQGCGVPVADSERDRLRSCKRTTPLIGSLPASWLQMPGGRRKTHTTTPRAIRAKLTSSLLRQLRLCSIQKGGREYAEMRETTLTCTAASLPDPPARPSSLVHTSPAAPPPTTPPASR